MKKIKIALSWSRLSSYLECPMKFKAQYIDKDYPDDSDNVHFARGNRIHKQLEKYINHKKGQGDMPSMSAEAQNAIPLIDNIFDNNDTVVAERQLAIDQSWVKCDWFAKPAVVRYRGIVDMLAIKDDTMLSVDFKTGKFREYADGHGQLHLSTAILFSVMPNVNVITNSYVFVDHKQTIIRVMHREEVQKEYDYFNAQYDIVNNDTEFKPTKHKYCGFCLIKDRCPLFKKQDNDII